MTIRPWFVLALLVMALGPAGRVRAESFPSLDAPPYDAAFDAGPGMDAPSEPMDVMIGEDAGAAMDAGIGRDSGPVVPVPPSDGCSCRASRAAPPSALVLVGLMLGVAPALRRIRRIG